MIPLVLPALLACAGGSGVGGEGGDTGAVDTADSADSGGSADSADAGDTADSGDSGDSADAGDTADTGGPLPGTLGARRVGYLLVRPERLDDPSWPSDEQIRRLTHLNLAFFTIGEVWAGLTVVHEYDDPKLRAFVQRVRDQANRYGVELLASVGGWAYGNPTADGFCAYVQAASDAVERENFASRAAGTLDGMCDNGGRPCFDGIDLDVEYIGQSVDAGGECTDGGGTVGSTPDWERARDFRDLLIALRDRFGIVTIAGPGALYALKYSWAVMPEIADTVDFVNVMAYDYTGVWTQTYASLDTSAAGCAADTHQCWGCAAELPQAVTDHHAPLHPSPGAPGNYDFLCDAGEALEGEAVCDPWGGGALDWDSPEGQATCVNPYVLAADRAVSLYVDGLGIDPAKLNLGVGFYGRAFRNVGPSAGADAPGARDGLRQYFGGMCLDEGYCAGGDGVPAGSCTTTAGVTACPGEPPYYWLTGFVDGSAAPDPRAVTWAQIAAVCPEAAELDGVASLGGADSVPCATAGWVARYDEVAEAPWLEHAADGLFVTFDNPRSVAAKGAWALDRGLGGLMYWEIDQDDADLTLLDEAYVAMTAAGVCE